MKKLIPFILFVIVAANAFGQSDVSLLNTGDMLKLLDLGAETLIYKVIIYGPLLTKI